MMTIVMADGIYSQHDLPFDALGDVAQNDGAAGHQTRHKEDGAIVLRGTFAPWVEAMREGAEANLSDPGPPLCGPLCDEHAAAAGTGGRFHDDQFLWHRHAIFADFVLRAGAGAIAARAMGSRTAQSEARPVVGERPSRHGCCSPVDRQNALEAHILYDQLFVKEPGTAAPTPRHNDTPYRHKTRPRPVCSVWLALDEVDSRNVYHGAEGYPPVPDIDAGVASGQYELLGWDMAGFDCGLAAGEHIGCSLHPDVLHPSGNLE
ncbi:hypothetical protein EMIHUDRAFT_110081 [Emiliania huxleyi CCMP1516]|uniref:Uncharacterized protein n=2 Tax=Emiliania huxleyi TaxID=2903 RepID=A0A0D3KLG0_EMIH1|nr:hypothetical protein EMIHUDRAFT_110081 [Emiliania huxleyi CCMP1516]EOD36595.1 hypothetical protein EMIHUDRAFT_110081 [Emiliania huxleyi CCMP1516]|eukprot:XP_005789024.1 hypothetical protein EMIHUDRAFT_110081 [Emiliania huxleyi CCMP1516]